MPGPTIPAGAAQVLVAWRSSVTGPPYVATYGVTGTTPTVAQANAIMAIWVARWQVGVPASLSLTDVQIWQGPTGALTIVQSSSAPNVGGSAQLSLPVNCSTLVRKVTALGGRRGRGRMHLPGALETNVDGSGALTPASITTYNTRLGQVLADHAAAGFPMVLLHSLGSSTPTPITNLNVSPLIGTQGRRLHR